MQFDFFEALAARRDTPLKFAVHFEEFFWRGTLEGEDRLLVVADRKESSARLTLTGAGEKILGQLRQDFPLRLARVLRLVDEHMIEPGIELEQNPALVRAFQQRHRALDQILEIEQAAIALHPNIALHDGIADFQKREAALEDGGGLLLFAKRG